MHGSREAPTLFHAIGDVAAEVARQHSIRMTGAGIEKPDEWLGLEHGHQVTAHLLLMAAERAACFGLGTEDLVRFLRETAVAPTVDGHQLQDCHREDEGGPDGAG